MGYRSCNVGEPKKSAPREELERWMLQCWVGSCDCRPKLLPRVFQILPTTCNEPEVDRKMKNTNKY